MHLFRKIQRFYLEPRRPHFNTEGFGSFAAGNHTAVLSAVMSGSSSALLHRRPLRTGHASHPASGSSHSVSTMNWHRAVLRITSGYDAE